MSEYSPQEQAAYDIGFKIGKSLGATSAEFNANSKAKWTRAYQHQINELIKENEKLREQLAAEREKIAEVEDHSRLRQEVQILVDALAPLMRDDGHYTECPAPTQETHDTMPNCKAVQHCKRLQAALAECRDGYQEVADAHNAALATERERVKQAKKLQRLTEDNQIRWMQNCEKLEQQLASEREWREQMIDQLETMHKQLAAERERREIAERQTEMDTECIERIRNHGMKLEVELEEERKKSQCVIKDHSAMIEEALAAEREKHKGMAHHMEACRSLLKVTGDEVLYQAIKDLQQQLSAEREKVRPAIFDPEHYPEDKITQLEQQLVAEREKYKRSQEKVREYFDLLAIEREKAIS